MVKTSTAGDEGLIPGQGTKILRAMLCGRKIRNKEVAIHFLLSRVTHHSLVMLYEATVYHLLWLLLFLSLLSDSK